MGPGDSVEAARGEERVPWARAASAKANGLYRSNLRDDSKAILGSTSAHDQKHHGVPAPGHGSPELGRPAAACSLDPDTSDGDRGSAIFHSVSLETQGSLSCKHCAPVGRSGVESMRKEKRLPPLLQSGRAARWPRAGGEGPAEEDTSDSKAGKFMPKILGTFQEYQFQQLPTDERAFVGVQKFSPEVPAHCWSKKIEDWMHRRGFPKRRTLVRNDSLVTEFLLAGLTDHPELQQPLFTLFLMIYIVTMVGNLGLILLIGLNSHLHTPMYYFLFNLSFIDLCYSSVFTPKMLMNFVSRENIISYVGCMTQLFFFLFFVISECYMLTSMAYDRYVAICNPLLYRVTMSHQVCSLLTVAVYMMGFAGASAHTGCMLRLTFCSVNIINHYLCDILPLLQLSCTSTYVNEVVVLIVVGINITVPSFTILISYVFILSSILHIRSAQGRSKAFSTCSSHIIALSLFFGSAAFMYLKYSSPESMEQGKVSSVFYTNVGPMLNPLIYSLRNKDVKIALKKVLIKIWRRNMF
ncbi:olfactory receptor 8B3 [Ursus arctos]|uniref:olfactory receptor 8B3 n=1 Tax=Ursus arctos TaxID=9644 RepID=UPI002017866E|nr:olfactory receptor 8B3 [Ursus arctos]